MQESSIGLTIGDAFSKFIRESLYVPCKSMLEVGCGYGIASTFTRELTERLTLLDVDEKAVNYQKNRYKTDSGVFVYKRTKESFTGLFDIVYYFLSLHHIENTQKELHEAAKHLSAQGRLFVCELYSLTGDSFHHKDYSPHDGFSPSEIQSIFEATSLGIVRKKEVFTILHNGSPYLIYFMECHLDNT